METRRNYELSVLLKAGLSESEARRQTEALKEELERAGAEKVEIDYQGRIETAYKVDSAYSAYLAYLKLAVWGKTIAELRSKVRQNDKIIRSMFLRIERV